MLSRSCQRQAHLSSLALVLLAGACERGNSTIRLGGKVLQPRSSLSVGYSACDKSWTDVIISDAPGICETYQAEICAEGPVARPPGNFMVIRVAGGGAGTFPVWGMALQSSPEWGLPEACNGPGPGQSSVSIGGFGSIDFAVSGNVTLDGAQAGEPVGGHYELVMNSGAAIGGDFLGAVCERVKWVKNFQGPQCASQETASELNATCECDGRTASGSCAMDGGYFLGSPTYDCRCVSGDGSERQCTGPDTARLTPGGRPLMGCCPIEF
ncbi:MAG: hypothetical protein ACYC8T_14770 [Myxococcaceae bacterium]